MSEVRVVRVSRAAIMTTPSTLLTLNPVLCRSRKISCGTVSTTTSHFSRHSCARMPAAPAPDIRYPTRVMAHNVTIAQTLSR